MGELSLGYQSGQGVPVYADHGGVKAVFRYMALLWSPESPLASGEALALGLKIQATAPNWEVAFEGCGVRVLVADRSACFGVHRFCDDAGVVLGEVFGRLKNLTEAVPAYDARFNRWETWTALKSHARSLCSEFWGNFVAVMVDGGSETDRVSGGPRATFIFNDPSGSLPCYFTEYRGVQVVFSSVEDCRNVGLSFEVNWDFIRHRAVYGFLETEVPSLKGVSTVYRGECVRFDSAGTFVSRSLYWHPAHFTDASELIVDSAAAAKAVRAIAASCVHSLAGHHSSVLAQCSGGLDSSIVLGCLGSAPNRPQITCYTGYAADRICDERRWARYATQRGGYRHIETCQHSSAVSYRDMGRLAPAVEPGSYYTQWQRSALEREIPGECGATATFTGDQGDSSFCADSFVYAADHSFRRHGFDRRTLRTALQVASRSDKAISQVLANIVRREVLGRANAEERGQRSYFNRLVAPRVRKELAGPRESSRWLKLGRLSGELRTRLGTLAFPAEFYDLSTSARSQTRHLVAPLCAQPVVETCLRIPVDVHFDGGRSRGLARRAFADVVPAPILRRQWKDRPLLFFDEVIEGNLPFLREHLLEGALVREGVLDRATVELALKGGPTRSSAISSEIFSHLNLELWIRDCA
jgi:asparagine synthase (glutamine-hydrolysing)